MPKKKKNHTKETLALIFALVAVAFLLINSIYLIMYREKIVSDVVEDETLAGFGDNLPCVANSLLVVFVIIWFALMLAMSFAVYYIEKGHCKWYWLLALSLISLITTRIDTAVFGVIASLLYIKR